MSTTRGGPKQQKSLSQVFLKSPEPAQFVADTLKGLGVQEVLEIGPGDGILTKELVSQGMKVTCVERDLRFVEHLAEAFREFKGPTGSSLQVVHEDFLDFDLGGWLSSTGTPCGIVGNIPYHISSPILIKVLSSSLVNLRAIMMMTQKEFAERLAASKKSKAYGSLSVFAQMRTDISIEKTVSRHLFNPVPKVDSAIFLAKPLKVPFPAADLGFVETVTRRAFAQRRKKLTNSLGSLLGDLQLTPDQLARSPVDLSLRADALSPLDFYELAQWLKGMKSFSPPSP